MADTHGGILRTRILQRGPALRRGLVAAGLATAVLVGVLPAGADGPESGSNPNVTLTVTPSDMLGANHVVNVSGAGFPATSAGIIRQCVVTGAGLACDTDMSYPFLTTGTGEITSMPVQLKRTITVGFTTTYNCGISPCVVAANVGGVSSQHHISFAGAGTIPSSTTTPTTTPSPSTISPSTISPSSTTPSTFPSTTTTVPATSENLLCAILRPLGQALTFLQDLINGLLTLLGCAPIA